MNRALILAVACGFVTCLSGSKAVSASGVSPALPPDPVWSWLVMPHPKDPDKRSVTLKSEVPGWLIAHGLTRYSITLRNGSVKHAQWFYKKQGKRTFVQEQSNEALKVRFFTSGFLAVDKDIVKIRCVLFDPLGTRLGADTFVLP